MVPPLSSLPILRTNAPRTTSPADLAKDDKEVSDGDKDNLSQKIEGSPG